MITNCSSGEHETALRALCGNSPFGARIEAYLDAYGNGKYPFLDFYFAGAEGRPETALCRYYGTVIICGEASAEVISFTELLSPRIVICEELSSIPAGYTVRQGETMKLLRPTHFYSECADPVRLCGDMRPLKDVYALLTGVFGKGSLPRFDEYFVDVSHMIRHGAADVYALYEQGLPVCTVSVTSKSDTDAVIGAVATREDKRGKGLAASLLSHVCAELSAKGLSVWLHRERPIGIYEKLGFETVSGYCELLREI